MTEQELWKKVEAFFQKNFDMEPNPPIETILFLIGIQELGSGQQKYSKDDKLNLIHIAVCRLLEPYGYYKFKWRRNSFSPIRRHKRPWTYKRVRTCYL